MSVHEFPEWLEVKDRAGFWHDGTREDLALTTTLGLCALGAGCWFTWTLSHYGPLLGWW